MATRVFGSILLLVGTSIGGAMLALPVATAAGGLWHTILLLIVAWIIMTVGALFLLEVNLWFDERSNLVSMARHTLGRIGQTVTWISYVVLFYALLSAYMTGGSGMFGSLLSLIHIDLGRAVNVTLFVLLFGLILWRGIVAVDWVNRLLMSLKLIAYVAFICFLVPYVHPEKWQRGHIVLLLPAVMTAITSFGFSGSVPTLRAYLKGDVNKLRFTIIFGSLIPLICYILWIASAQGSVGTPALESIAKHGHAVSGLTNAITQFAHTPHVSLFTRLFTSICVMTAFLGVGIAVTDFFADGFKLDKQSGVGNLSSVLITLLPPFAIVLFYPALFLKAISFAGVFCVILLALLPCLMVLTGRYVKKQATIVIVPGGKFVVCLWIIISLILLAISILY